MLNLVQIGCYLQFNQKTYFLYLILDNKNFKFKHFIDDIAINF